MRFSELKRLTFVFYCLLLWCLLGAIKSEAATKRALVIGIGDYPAASGWSKINGDKDIPVVENMLVNKGFERRNIVTLKNEQATYRGIIHALENLVAWSKKDDFVYIHFSGHGQQITDRHGDEPTGYDEAWIPYDAQFAYQKGKYEGECHLVDDELNQWLHKIREKIGQGGKLIVVADACHSYGGTRSLLDDEDDFVVRGTDAAFVIPMASAPARIAAHTMEWIFISACKATQCNYEYQGMGSLTYALVQEAADFETLTCKQLQNRLLIRIRELIPFTQIPAVETAEGSATQLFF